MTIIALSPVDLSIAATLVLFMAATSFLLKLGITKQIVVSTIRMTIQLSLVGFVLKAIFASTEII